MILSKLFYGNSRRASEIKGDGPNSFCNRSAGLFSVDPTITVYEWLLFCIEQLVWCHAMLNIFWLLCLYLYRNGNYLNITFQTWKFPEVLIWKDNKIILVNSFKRNWHLKNLGKLSLDVCGLCKAACCILLLVHGWDDNIFYPK